MIIFKPILRKSKRIANKIFGTKVDEFYWKFRHFFDKKWAESYISKESINHPHRDFLVEKISKNYPFDSALEIGCASGPNLYLLGKKFPKVKFYGIDISKKAIQTARTYFKRENIENVYFNSSKAEELGGFEDKSIDIVFADAALIYEGPDKIDLIIKEMLRIAKKAIILCEQHNESCSSFYKDHWIHNYKALFSKFIEEERVKVTKIPKEAWSGDWIKFGYIIEVII